MITADNQGDHLPPPAAATVLPDVSVVIVCWNSGRYIGRCLRSVREQTRGLRAEVLVVDNGSADDTLAIVGRDAPEAMVFEARANLGFPRGNNWAIRHARGRYVMLLNPDTELVNDALTVLVQALEAHAAAGAAGPCILEPDGSNSVFAVRRFPSLCGALARYWGLHALFPRAAVFHPDALPRLDRAQPAVVPALSGAAMLLPRHVLDRIGLLDEQLPMYFEDLDLCARLRAAGLSCQYVPAARITHWGGASASLSPVSLRLWGLEQGEAPWLYFRTYRGRLAAALFTAIAASGCLGRLVVAGAGLLLTAGRAGGARRVFWRAASVFSWATVGRRRLLRAISAAFAPPDYEPERSGRIQLTDKQAL